MYVQTWVLHRLQSHQNAVAMDGSNLTLKA
jgi:hypothetical protein